MDSSSSTPRDSALECSSVFNDPDADLRIVSSDNIVLKVYRKHLETATAGFPPSNHIVVDHEPVKLEETLEVLEMLFKFIHPPTEAMQHRQPSVMDMEAAAFFAFAEAAEKYIVYGAVNLCVSRMRYTDLCESNPFEVLNYAHRHGYPELEDKAAFASLSRHVDLDEIQKVLTDLRLQMRWIHYRHQWEKMAVFIQEQANSFLDSGYKCPRMALWHLRYLKNISQDIRTAAVLEPNIDMSVVCVMGKSYCGCTQKNTWHVELKAMEESFRKFSQITL